MKNHLINFTALITIPTSVTINVASLLEYKEILNFGFTLILSIVGAISGFYACKNLFLKNQLLKKEIEQKDKEQKPNNEKKESVGFFKNNVIK